MLSDDEKRDVLDRAGYRFGDDGQWWATTWRAGGCGGPAAAWKHFVARGDVYRHKKGGVYRLLHRATHTETLEEMAVYEHIWPHEPGVWARPMALFSQPDRFRRLE